MSRYSKNRRHGSSHRKLVGFLFWLVVAALLIYGFVQFFGPKDGSIANLNYLKASTPTPTPTPAIRPLEIQARWQGVLDEYPTIRVSIVMRDLDSSTTAQIGGNEIFRAASTTKLIAASYFLHSVEKGEHTLSEKMGSSTAKFQLQQMINRSNNDSWALFLSTNGRDNQQAYAKLLGLHTYNIANNDISASDLVTLLQLLWSGDLMNNEHKTLVLGYMQDTIDEKWMPPAIPDGAVIYHKYGALEDDIHDAAIITYNGHTYALVIMSNGNGKYAYEARAELFHALVQASFNQKTPTPSPSNK